MVRWSLPYERRLREEWGLLSGARACEVDGIESRMGLRLAKPTYAKVNNSLGDILEDKEEETANIIQIFRHAHQVSTYQQTGWCRNNNNEPCHHGFINADELF